MCDRCNQLREQLREALFQAKLAEAVRIAAEAAKHMAGK